MNQDKTIHTTIRIPEQLHAAIKQEASKQDRSFNNMLIRFLDKSVKETKGK